MLILACILAGVLETRLPIKSPNTFISSASCFGEQVTADLVVPTPVLTSVLTSVLDASEEMVTSMFRSAKLLFELTFSGIGSEKMKADEGEEVVGGGLAPMDASEAAASLLHCRFLAWNLAALSLSRSVARFSSLISFLNFSLVYLSLEEPRSLS